MSKISKNNGGNTSVKVLTITAKGILLSLPQGDFFLGYNHYPWFENASVKQVFDVKMETPRSIRWDDLDVDLEIESILHPNRYPEIARG